MNHRTTGWTDRTCKMGVGWAAGHNLALLFALMAMVASFPALALDAVAIRPDVTQVSLSGFMEPHVGVGTALILGSGEDGSRVEAHASAGNTDPNWLAFSLRNDSGEPLVRWFVVENTGSVDSGLLLPVLTRPRILSVAASDGPPAERIEAGTADVFELTVPAGEVVVFIAETAGRPPSLAALIEPATFAAARRGFEFFHGLLVGIVGLLAIFLTTLFVVRRKIMYPAAAGVGWASLAMLGAEFGLWEQSIGLGSTASAALRVGSEALFAGAGAFLLYSFLELRARSRKFHVVALITMALAIVGAVAGAIDPPVGGTIARFVLLAVAILGAVVIGRLLVAGSRRAMSLAPAWGVIILFTALSLAVQQGMVPGDLARPLYAAALVLVVMIVSLTVMQYAFDSDVSQDANASELGFKAIAFAATGLAVWDWSVIEETIAVGREVEAALGVQRGSLTGGQERWLEQVYQADRDRFMQTANTAVADPNGSMDIELRLRSSVGGHRWYHLRARAVARDGKSVTRFVGSLEDITAGKNSQERLLRDAVNDALTGLPNRVLFLDRLGRAIARAQSQDGRRPSVIVIDIDRFKNVNDGFGHAVGDSILTIIAQRLSELIDPQDTLARIQGDQFAVMVTSAIQPEDMEVLGADLQQTLKQPIYVGEQEVFLTGSFGIASYDADRHINADELMREAELAMVYAKGAGADRVETFQPSMQSERSDRLTLESDLRRALERGEVELLYQPILSIADERIAGFEALMRWHHPEHGEMSPDDFIAIAEEIGLIVELGHFALDTAARQLSTWLRTFSDAPDLFVSVNVSSRQIFRQDLMRDVRLVLTRANIPPRALRLEITESLVMENPELAAYVLERLSAMGAGLALDDFGTGYSALSYLQRFPFDTVKVDKSIVTGGQGNAPVIMKSIVGMAHDLGMAVVAEGAETAEDVAYLKEIGCEFAQGFHFAPPLDVASATKYLAEWR